MSLLWYMSLDMVHVLYICLLQHNRVYVQFLCVCVSAKMSQQDLLGCTVRRSLQFHLLGRDIRQLTNPFNIVYLASLAHHFKGITLSGESRRERSAGD